jgi:hypothetical protein
MRATPRKSTVFIMLAGTLLALMALAAAHSSLRAARMEPEVLMRAGLVRELGLSDLCLFTEARYTRHPSVTDLNSAFQDHPLSLEHFPTGSLMDPPGQLVKGVH